MPKTRLESNLTRMLQELDQYALVQHAVGGPTAGDAATLSNALFLAHSTAARNFSQICAWNRLLSTGNRGAVRNVPIDPDSAEAIMGTVGFVFLYIGPFRFPGTACGFLFSPTIETEHREAGMATPFDSGGLPRVFSRSDPAEPVRDFLRRHELPIPDHRRYLGGVISALFSRVSDYVDGVEPRLPGPIGLTGGDARRWTHEVRVPDQLFVRTGHLEAVFVTRRLANDNEIENLIKWCGAESIDVEVFDAPRGDDFETLQRRCREYVRRRLL